jgi:hypothetical protein
MKNIGIKKRSIMYTVIVFDYESWMILVYKGGKNIEYWCSDEHDWEQAWKTIGYMKPKEEIYITANTYEKVCEIIGDADIFDLSKKDIERLRQYTED